MIRTLIEWLAGLLKVIFGGKRSAPVPEKTADEPVKGDPAWLKLARADLGIKEVPGPESNPRVMRYWSACDYDPHPDDSKDAWCSAAANYWMQKSGNPGTRQPNARSWERWGAELKKPKPGAVTVFWRVSPTDWRGHVGLYIGPGKKPRTIKVLGGNQDNAVSIEEYSEDQLLGYRWPTTGGNSRTLRAQTAGLLGDSMTIAAISGKGIVEALPDALALSEGVKSLAVYWPWFAVVGIVIGIAARAVTIYARVSDWQEKGV